MMKFFPQIVQNSSKIFGKFPQPQKVYAHVIRLNGNADLLQSLTDYIQFSNIVMLNSMLQGKCEVTTTKGTQVKITPGNFHSYRDVMVMQTDNIYSILHGIYSSVIQYQVRRSQDYEDVKLENMEYLQPLDEQKNFINIMFSTSDDQKIVTATFSRPHILNSGNMSVL